MHECQKNNLIVKFTIQKLKNKHISLKKYTDWAINPRSCDSEFRILISVQKMCPLDCIVFRLQIVKSIGFSFTWLEKKCKKWNLKETSDNIENDSYLPICYTPSWGTCVYSAATSALFPFFRSDKVWASNRAHCNA